MLTVINSMNGPNIVIDGMTFKMPKILRNHPSAAAIVAFLGNPILFRVFGDLGFDHSVKDGIGRTLGHFACAGGNFEVVRELDSLGFDWTQSHSAENAVVPHYAAEYAAAFGHLHILQWLWTKGYLRAEPMEGWWLGDYRAVREVDCLFAWRGGVAPACGWSCILLAAADGGHAEVVRFLICEVGIQLPSHGGPMH
jgi:hypothetical protein